MIPRTGSFNVTKQVLPQIEGRSLGCLIVGFLFGQCIGWQNPIRPQFETADPHAIRLTTAILYITQLQQIGAGMACLMHECRIAAAHIIVIRIIHLMPIRIKQPNHRIALGRQALGIHFDGEPFPRLGVQREPMRSLPRQGAGTDRGHVLQRIHQYQPRHADPLGIMHTHHAHLNGHVCRQGHAKDRLFALGLDQLGLRRKTRPEFQIARQPITVHANFHRLAGRPCGGLHGAQRRQRHRAHDAQKGEQ